MWDVRLLMRRKPLAAMLIALSKDCEQSMVFISLILWGKYMEPMKMSTGGTLTAVLRHAPHF